NKTLDPQCRGLAADLVQQEQVRIKGRKDAAKGVRTREHGLAANVPAQDSKGGIGELFEGVGTGRIPGAAGGGKGMYDGLSLINDTALRIGEDQLDRDLGAQKKRS